MSIQMDTYFRDRFGICTLKEGQCDHRGDCRICNVPLWPAEKEESR